MNTQSFFRLSGLALVVGGAVSFAFHLVSAFFYGDTTTYANQPINIITEFVLAAASILLLIGLPGVYASRAQGFGIVGLIGMGLVFIAGIMLDVFANLLGAMVDPGLQPRPPTWLTALGLPRSSPSTTSRSSCS